MVAKVEFLLRGGVPAVGFIVTNLTAPNCALLQQARHGGTLDQGRRQAVKMTRLSCHSFRANQVRLLLSALPYNLGNLWRRLALPTRVANWSLTSLQAVTGKNRGPSD